MNKKAKPAETVYINREISWLMFNERVLDEAADINVPVFERLKYISIFMNNLDEFFMIRVGSLQDQALMKGAPADNKTGLTPKEQISALLKQTRQLTAHKDAVYYSCVKKLARFNIRRLNMDDLTEPDEAFVKDYYMREIYPLLSPQIIDNRHPFPFLVNKGIYIGVYFESHHDMSFGIIPAVGAFSRVVMLPGPGTRYVLSEDIIHHYADMMFSSHNLLGRMVFRVTRNADIMTDVSLFDEDADFRFTMKELLKKRVKLAPVRLEIQGKLKKEFIRYLCKKLNLELNRVFLSKSPLDLSHVARIEDMLTKVQRSRLLFTPLQPQTPADINREESITAQIISRDLLLAYPFESIQPLIRLLYEAADDPDVVSVKITLYRVGKESEIVRSLIKAAENGKDVTVVVELRARFDEEDNIEWATRLSEAGCRVIYGINTYKVHCKVLLITRKTDKSIQYLTQIGTGNYNERTARLYTDLSLFTANPEVGLDAVALFNDILVNNVQGCYKHLLVAPSCMRSSIISLIHKEIEHAQKGERAFVFAKFNALTDKEIIDKLIEASQAGVTIRLIVRGICCLKPGIPTLTDNITVVSVVGRFLEHSRVYCFGDGERKRVYISSADWMTRNNERRIEVACPVFDKAIAARIEVMMKAAFYDNVKARVLTPEGLYCRQQPREGEKPVDSQLHLFEQAYAAAGKEFGQN